MSLHKLPRGVLEIPKGTNTSCNDNSTFMNNLERTNSLLAQFVSSTDISKKLIMRQELEESYFNLTMYNLKDSIKHKIEQDMWNNLFKKYISDLQNKIKNKDKSESSKAQAEISIFLDEAVGFYSKCIDTLSLVYNIRLPGGEGQHKISQRKNRISEEVTEEDIRYIIQHFYVHMGDLSRYHNLSKHAKFYYELAVQLSPSSGHAYNQLAILESSAVGHSSISTGNYRQIIRTILMYEYANTCRSPFPATRINLESLLRHVNEQSVSTLLTSNISVGDQNCVHSMCIAWIHAYANLHMLHNVQRCRQLQQRIVDWAGELVKCSDTCRTHWRELASITALHCSLLTSYTTGTEYVENKTWTTNMHQFTQDFINAVSRGLVSLSHDSKLMEELLANPGCVSIIVIFMAWVTRYLEIGANSSVASHRPCPLKIPFGEDFVRFINIIVAKSESSLSNDVIKLPCNMPEINLLTGFQPLGVPCILYDIYSDQQSAATSDSMDCGDMDTRVVFIVSVCRKLAAKWGSLLSYSDKDRRFTAVAPPEPVVKKHVKIEPSVVTRKPVNNVALASMKHTKPPNGFISGNIGNVHSTRMVPTVGTDTPVATKGVVTDVKIAKCIQEHIAQDIKTDSSSGTVTTTNTTTSPLYTRDDQHIIAPAPGLILSSSLPPEYKSMSSVSSTTEQVSGTAEQAQSGSTDQSDHSKTSSITSSLNSKNHSSYNPNREQFEKDLPPRFANKRSYSQESAIVSAVSAMDQSTRSGYFDHQNNGGFTSMNYWDSINDFPNGSGGSGSGQHNSQFDSKNLAKKESELLLPPTVPTSWLTDDVGGLKLDSAINSTSIQYPFGNNLIQQKQQQQQQAHSYSALQSPAHSHMGMLQQSFNHHQFQQQQQQNHQAPPAPVSSAVSQSAVSLKEQQDSQLQYLLQAVTTNAASTPRFRSQTDALLSAQMNNFDSQLSFMQQQHQQHANAARLTPKFQAIPPPSQQSMNVAHNYDSFPMARSGFYDKPVFSSTNSSQSAAFGYSSASMMPSSQQQLQQQQQQQLHNQQQQQQQPIMMQQQVRHNNPLLNLLPGYMNNEAQR